MKHTTETLGVYMNAVKHAREQGTPSPKPGGKHGRVWSWMFEHGHARLLFQYDDYARRVKVYGSLGPLNAAFLLFQAVPGEVERDETEALELGWHRLWKAVRAYVRHLRALEAEQAGRELIATAETVTGPWGAAA